RAFWLVHLFEAHSPWTAPPARVTAARGDGYRAEIAEADSWLGRAARTAELRGDTWIVVTGDHGESLGDHRETTHGLFVYESTLDVPAVVWPAPRGESPGLRDGTFRLVDFPATAFALLGLPSEEAPGTGLAALGPGRKHGEAGGPRDGAPAAPVLFESLYGYLHHGWAPLRGLRQGDWKYVAAPEPELYHLTTDPGERENVAALHPERTRELAARLEDEIRRETAAPTAHAAESARIPLDEDARAALESLGYVTGDAGPPEIPPGDLPDPKDMAKVVLNLERAQAALAAGQPEAALGLLRDAVSRDPRNKDLHHLMGLAHAAAGRPDWAVDSFRRALELPPHRNDRLPRFELASCWIRLGHPERAEEELRTLLAEWPDDGTAWYHLGLALEAQGRPDEAREAWAAAVEREPEIQDAVNASMEGSSPR
ncbi:MAG TPA: tetratricopeptide repeat protein, partial [bacterium]|nr:tetratricopeptide repeat protein [bacterium]